MANNKTAAYDFTILVPVYNEEDNIERLEKSFLEFIPTCTMKTCVLFINDASTDRSKEKIEQVCEKNKDFFYISFEKNGGLSAAIKAGIDFTASKYVGYIDADLQTTPEDFNLLLEHAPYYELVAGIRANRKDSAFKNFQSKVANGFRRAMTKDTATDTGCPLKVLHTDFAKRIPFFTGMHRFLAALTLMLEGKYKEIPVRHFPRIAGESKYHLWNRLKGPFVDCFAFRWMKKRVINYKVNAHNL